jgi:LemA protein
MSPVLILVIIVVAVALYVVSVYNGLQTLKTRIVASIQEIGNQLKRQANLIPNLEESVKAYLSHEKGIFKMLADARMSVNAAVKDGSVASADKAATQIQNLLPKISVILESNPQLQANTTITQFMDELRDTADKLTYARRTLIDLTQEYNMRLVTFPSSLVASTFGFHAEAGLTTPTDGAALTVSADEMVDPKVKLN